MKRKTSANAVPADGFVLRAAMVHATIHRSEIDKEKGEVKVSDEFVTGTPEHIKAMAAPNKVGQVVEVSYGHTFSTLDKEEMMATNSGTVKKFSAKARQDYSIEPQINQPIDEPQSQPDERTSSDESPQENNRSYPTGPLNEPYDKDRYIKNWLKLLSAAGIVLGAGLVATLITVLYLIR